LVSAKRLLIRGKPSMRRTLQGELYEAARRNGRRRALGFYSARGEIEWLTYDELLGLGLGAAGWFRNQGVHRGDACVLAVGDARRTAVLLLGVLALGAIPLSLPPFGNLRSSGVKAGFVRAVVRRARARLVVTDEPVDSFAGWIDPSLVRDLCVHDLAQEGPLIEPVLPSEHAVASYQLTSGTTRAPRVCVWGQQALVTRLETTRKALRVGEGDTFVSWAPLHHTMGLLNNFFLCLTSGIPLVLIRPNDFVKSPALWLRALSETRATETWSANFGFALAVEKITDDELRGVRLDSVRGFWNAAERIHLETFASFYRRFRELGLRLGALKTNYGSAENVGGATFGDPTADFVVERVRPDALYERGIAERIEESSAGAVPVMSVGRPCSGLRVEILRRGRRVPDGHVGEVVLVSSARMRGYLRDAASTKKALRGRRLLTGDLGYLRGGELFWTGRISERITIRGRKIDPSDFEPVLSAIEGLEARGFAAFGVDDVTQGTQKAVIVAEVRAGARDVDRIVRAIRAGAQRELGVALHDVLLVRRGTLTKTMSGKRRHAAYREPYRDGSLEALRVR
jgi:fatty-acyl-CoA synthase